MKKVFFSLAVLCSVALVSCGGKTETAETPDTLNVEETTVTVSDSTPATDSTPAEAAQVSETEAQATTAPADDTTKKN